MFARVSTYHGTPNKVREATRLVQEVTPDMQKMPGFQSAYLLVDGKSGNAIAFSLWGTEEETNRSTSTAGSVRDRISQTLGARGQPPVEIYEIGHEITHRPEGAKFARVSRYHGTSNKTDEGIRAARETESSLKQMQGFHRLLFFSDRKTGHAMTISFWDSEDSMNRSASGVNPLRDRISQALGATQRPTVETYEVAGDIPQRARRAA